MKFGLIVIGDEILHGEREDAHFTAIKNILKKHAMLLAWVQYLPDDRQLIAQVLKTTLSQANPVFITGGIGATPDDHTRQAAGLALELDLCEHPVAASFINQIAQDRNEDLDSPIQKQRLQMAHFPRGSEIILNPYNKIAGFHIHQHYFLPGFPVMAHPMVEWVIDQFYSGHEFQEKTEQRAIHVFNLQESQIAPIMEQIQLRYPGVLTTSLPSVYYDKPSNHGTNNKRAYQIELGIKASNEACQLIENAWVALLDEIVKIGGQLEKI